MIRMNYGVIIAALLVMPQIASAQLDCIVPTRESTAASGLALNSPALAAIRKAALEVEGIIKKNARFMAGARPIRVRTTIQYSHAAPWTANVFTAAYNQEAWVGKCGLSPFADRGGGLRDGTILVHINEPRGLLGLPVGDAALEVFEAPKQIANTAGYATFRGTLGDTVLLTIGGALPWIPVTIAEALDFEDRRLAERQADWQREKQKPGLSEAKVKKCFDDMKKINPALAEDACGGLRAALQDQNRQRSQHEAEMEAHLGAQVSDLRTYRASFTAAQLQQPAHLNGNRDSGIGRVDDPNGPVRVKVDPEFRRLDLNRIRVISVAAAKAMSTDTIPGRYQWTRAYTDAIDCAALAKLLQ